MNTLLNKTLSGIVIENHRTAQVFEKYGMDFCCKGNRPLKEVCEEKHIDLDTLLIDLNIALAGVEPISDVNDMSLTELAEYIVRVHHTYVKLNSPIVLNYTKHIASKHGDRFPYMNEVSVLFEEVKLEMEQHMLKEEKSVFPGIKLLEITPANNTAELLLPPIDELKAEHDAAGTIMQKIRLLTNNYEAPEQACTTHRLTLASLKAFEEDLHQHVHLENNILFPKAIRLSNIQNMCSQIF